MTFSELLISLAVIACGVAIVSLYLAARNFGWFSLCPHIDSDDDRVIAQTGRLPWLLTLTLFYRSVAVDPQRREVIVSRLLFWTWPTMRRISFDEIAAVIYHFEEGSLTVALRLQSGDHVHLFYFWGPFDDSGRAASQNEDTVFDSDSHVQEAAWHFPAALFSDQRDYSERTALAFVSRLQELTGAPLAA